MFERLKKVGKELLENENIDWDNVQLSSKLKEDLGFDSVSFIMLSIGIEENFGCSISQDDAQNFIEIGDIVKYLEANATK